MSLQTIVYKVGELLTMIATVHRYRGTSPGARVELYKEICEVFLGKRQEARGIAQDLRSEQRQLVLQPLAYEMMLHGERELPSQKAKQIILYELPQIGTSLTPRAFLESIQNSSGLLLAMECERAALILQTPVQRQVEDVMVNALRSGSPALLMKLVCLVRNDRMRDEIVNLSNRRFGVLLCFHLHFSPFPQN